MKLTARPSWTGSAELEALRPEVVALLEAALDLDPRGHVDALADRGRLRELDADEPDEPLLRGARTASGATRTRAAGRTTACAGRRASSGASSRRCALTSQRVASMPMPGPDADGAERRLAHRDHDRDRASALVRRSPRVTRTPAKTPRSKTRPCAFSSSSSSNHSPALDDALRLLADERARDRRGPGDEDVPEAEPLARLRPRR